MTPTAAPTASPSSPPPCSARDEYPAGPRPSCATGRYGGLGALAGLRVEAIDDRPFPVQVDGDYIGDYADVEFGVTPGGLLAVA